MDADSDDSDDQPKEVIGVRFYVKRVSMCICALSAIVGFGYTAMNLRGGEAPDVPVRFECDSSRREVNFTRYRMQLLHGSASDVAFSGGPLLHFEHHRGSGFGDETFAVAVAGVSGAWPSAPPATPAELLDARIAAQNLSVGAYHDLSACDSGNMSSHIANAVSLSCGALPEGAPMFSFAMPQNHSVAIRCSIDVDRALLNRSAEALHLLVLSPHTSETCNAANLWGQPGSGGPHTHCLTRDLAIGASTPPRAQGWNSSTEAEAAVWGGASGWGDEAVTAVLNYADWSQQKAAAAQPSFAASYSYSALKSEWVSLPLYPLGPTNATTQFLILLWEPT